MDPATGRADGAKFAKTFFEMKWIPTMRAEFVLVVCHGAEEGRDVPIPVKGF
jgi:hypothetical protein